MHIQITMEVDLSDWGKDNTSEEGIIFAQALIKGEADWPIRVRIDSCTGINLSEEFIT